MAEVGISGWNYKGLRGTFYPSDLPQKKELFFASRELPTIEINGTFYGLQRPKSYLHWYEITPKGFVFSVKANRYISHVKRLNGVEETMANFLASGPLALREKLGPFLWQFPPSMGLEPDRFETFLKLLPKDFKQAVKLGKESTLPPERKWPYLEDITADFIYVRLHGDSKLYVSGYDDEMLAFWSRRIKTWKEGLEPADRLTISDERPPLIERDVYVYFDNDAKVREPVDAKSLIRRLS